MEEAFSDDERDNHWWMVVGEVNEVGIYGDNFCCILRGGIST